MQNELIYNKNNNCYDLIGVGCGPFNLSLNVLINKTGLTSIFLEQNPHFSWHAGILLDDVNMQTSFFKDMVTTVDPTNELSFLKFLHDKENLWHFLNRKTLLITRKEFHAYMEWVVQKLKNIQFNSAVKDIQYSKNGFKVITNNKSFLGSNVSIGVGNVPNIPDCLKPFQSKKVFHSSTYIYNKPNDINKLRILVIGGGQSGAEIILDLLNSITPNNSPQSIIWISERMSFFQLDENPLAEIIYLPHFASKYTEYSSNMKNKIRESSIYTANGISASTAQDLYEKIYRLKFIHNIQSKIVINPGAKVINVNQSDDALQTEIVVCDTQYYSIQCDYIICATGYRQAIPSVLGSLLPYIKMQDDNKFLINSDLSLNFELSNSHKIYVQNLSEHLYGLAESQLSILPWKNALIANSLLGKNFYKTNFESALYVDLEEYK